MTLPSVLFEVAKERARQDARWGPQALPDGTGAQVVHRDKGVLRDLAVLDIKRQEARAAQANCDRAAAEGCLTYRHILEEEVAEAFAEDDIARLRAELIQVAAVATKWVEAIDRRTRL